MKSEAAERGEAHGGCRSMKAYRKGLAVLKTLVELSYFNQVRFSFEFSRKDIPRVR